MEYNPSKIEQKWRKRWEEQQVYRVENGGDKPKYYVLDMFPYPSGAGLHVGHPLGYVASDIIARYKRLSGFNVLHPMGYDAFGLPAEQYAIETGIHPEQTTLQNTQKYRQQLDNLGFSFDWSREVNTSAPQYYKWTQQIFLWLFEHYYDKTANKALPIATLVAAFEQNGNADVAAVTTQKSAFTADQWRAFAAKEKDDILMNYRLAYRKVGYVNWCEALGTVLANDEVKDGLSERGGHPVIKKPMMQWVLRITAYAERLLQGLETVDFSEAIKTQQRNWIGKSEGATMFFSLQNGKQLEIFTTRPDTIFGASFIVLAPEHAWVKELTTADRQTDVDKYLHYVESRSERDRQADVKHITGAFTGSYAIHPFTKQPIPVWISEYVLIGYGAGAIMAVPAEDDRDNRFAKHFNLPIVPVLDKTNYPNAEIGDKVGTYINSDFLNGLSVAEGIAKALDAIEAQGLGKRRINYKLHDANFSRQRYWGEPFPIKYDGEGVAHVETQLPLELPTLREFKPTADGQSPLARVQEWVQAGDMKRETDTMPGYAGSSWYFLRYMDAHNDQEAFSQDAVHYWQSVDLYVGGSEHAVGHLLYSRFWHKFLYDLGKVPTQEPFKKLINQGMIQGIVEYIYMLKDKRDGKTVFVSADLIKQYDEDSYTQLPVYVKFVTDYGLPESYLNANGLAQFKEWRPEFGDAIFELNEKQQLVTRSEVGKMSKRWYNVVNPDDVVAQYGADCFRMYEMFLGPLEDSKPWNTKGIDGVYRFMHRFWSLFFDVLKGERVVTDEDPTRKELKVLHTCLKKISNDLETFSLNTSVSAFMIAVNELKDLKCNKRAILEPLTIAIAPFAPHFAEELWAALGNEFSIHDNNKVKFPAFDEAFLVEDEVSYPISINGKHRATRLFATNAEQTFIEQEVLAMPEVQKWTEGKEVAKIIFVKNRMINIVVK